MQCDASVTRSVLTECTEVSELVRKMAHLVEWTGTILRNGIYVLYEIRVQAPLKDKHISLVSRAQDRCQLSAECPQK